MSTQGNADMHLGRDACKLACRQVRKGKREKQHIARQPVDKWHGWGDQGGNQQGCGRGAFGLARRLETRAGFMKTRVRQAGRESGREE